MLPEPVVEVMMVCCAPVVRSCSRPAAPSQTWASSHLPSLARLHGLGLTSFVSTDGTCSDLMLPEPVVEVMMVVVPSVVVVLSPGRTKPDVGFFSSLLACTGFTSFVSTDGTCSDLMLPEPVVEVMMVVVPSVVVVLSPGRTKPDVGFFSSVPGLLACAGFPGSTSFVSTDGTPSCLMLPELVVVVVSFLPPVVVVVVVIVVLVVQSTR